MAERPAIFQVVRGRSVGLNQARLDRAAIVEVQRGAVESECDPGLMQDLLLDLFAARRQSGGAGLDLRQRAHQDQGPLGFLETGKQVGRLPGDQTSGQPVVGDDRVFRSASGEKASDQAALAVDFDEEIR